MREKHFFFIYLTKSFRINGTKWLSTASFVWFCLTPYNVIDYHLSMAQRHQTSTESVASASAAVRRINSVDVVPTFDDARSSRLAPIETEEREIAKGAMMNETKSMKLFKVGFALGDIRETLSIWRDSKPFDDPYIQKLLNERDELLTKWQKLTA